MLGLTNTQTNARRLVNRLAYLIDAQVGEVDERTPGVDALAARLAELADAAPEWSQEAYGWVFVIRHRQRVLFAARNRMVGIEQELENFLHLAMRRGISARDISSAGDDATSRTLEAVDATETAIVQLDEAMRSAYSNFSSRLTSFEMIDVVAAELPAELVRTIPSDLPIAHKLVTRSNNVSIRTRLGKSG